MTLPVVTAPRSDRSPCLSGVVILFFALLGPVRAAETVILSEFMAANTRTMADETRAFEDWIELRNTSTNAVALEGWSLTTKPTQPRQWMFPATNLAAGGHLVVWASGKDRRRPGAPLHTNFRLAREGEYLALVQPDGATVTAFKPAYPPQYADASFGFFPGATPAVYFATPTPGRPNESAAKPPGPFIASVEHAPAVPKSNEAVVVTARILPVLGPVTSVTLHWRAMFARESNLLMTARGEGVWTATFPAQAVGDGQMLRWRVTAQDTAGRASQFPLFSHPQRTAQYLGTVRNPQYVTSALPVFHLYISPQSMGGAESDGGARCCVFHDGEFYDNVFIKVRGNTTAGFPKKSHRLEFPPEHPFRHPGPGGRVRHTSLMAEWGDPTLLRQHLSFWMQAETGSAAPFHYPVRVQLNGAFWQCAMHSEVLGEELLERHGLDPDGALYKAVGTLTPDFSSTGGFEKKTRRQEGNQDYVKLALALHERHGLEGRRRALFDQMNLPAVINYLAVARLTQEDDDLWANMSLYHDCDGTQEWRPIPFDMNVSWGLSFAMGGVQATLDDFRSHPFFGAADIGANQGFNRLYDAVVQVPETRAMLVRRMRTILDRWWQPPGTVWTNRVIEQHIAQVTNQMWAEAALDRAKWGNTWLLPGNTRPADALTVGVRELVEHFIEPRRRHFYVTHSITNSARPLGVGHRHRAGIPEAQPANARIDFGEVLLCTTNRAMDYVCLTNANAFAVDLSDWALEGPARFTFQPGTVLPAHGALYVSPDVKTFRARSAAESRGGRFVVGNFSGRPDPARRMVLKNDRVKAVAER